MQKEAESLCLSDERAFTGTLVSRAVLTDEEGIALLLEASNVIDY